MCFFFLSEISLKCVNFLYVRSYYWHPLFSFFFSVSHAGLQLHPGRHGDSAQHWSGYFVYTLFYLKTALLQESTMLSILLSIRANLLPLSAPRDEGWGPRRALSSVLSLWNHKEDRRTEERSKKNWATRRKGCPEPGLELQRLHTSSRSGSSSGERADRTDELFHFKS